jgi:hypothetical protein
MILLLSTTLVRRGGFHKKPQAQLAARLIFVNSMKSLMIISHQKPAVAPA